MDISTREKLRFLFDDTEALIDELIVEMRKQSTVTRQAINITDELRREVRTIQQALDLAPDDGGKAA